MLLIGSEALRHWGVEVPRASLDIDIVCKINEFKRWCRETETKYVKPIADNKYLAKAGEDLFEFEISWPGDAIYPWLEGIEDHKVKVATVEQLLYLKLSHRYLKNSPHFLKTMEDIQLLRQCADAENYDEFLKQREAETYNYSHPKLNMSKSDFFDASVEYTYDHDSIHEAIALYDKPAYLYYKVEGAEVMCSKDKFFSVDEKYRLAGVIEEAGVLALERGLIPYNTWNKQRVVYEYALMKVCTSITSGWFREYAWENYYKALECYRDLKSLFDHGKESGIIKRA
jgi:hypothetical protein